MHNAPDSLSQLDEFITTPPPSVVDAVGNTKGDFAILGAGGKMGYHVTRMLQRALTKLGRNDGITVVSRFASSDSRARFETLGLRVVAADLSQPADVARLPLAENVVFLAGMKFGTASSPELLQTMNVHMPRLIAQHFRQSKIVALSTGCVYSFTTPESGGSKEDDEMNPPGEYARSCIGREQAFLDGSRTHGTNAAIVRLNYSIDLRYGVLVDIAKDVLNERPVDVETGYVNVIWQGDAVAHVLQCFPHTSSPPLIVNVTGQDILKVRELAIEFAARFGCDVSFRGGERSTAWLSDSRRSHQMFGVPRVTVGEMIDWIANWLQRGGETLDKPTHFQTRDGNY